LLLLFFIAEIFVNPLADFPLNDDWSYSKSVKFLLEKNQLTIGNWCAMTLVTQIYWGFLWTKIFGFTFTVLRFSNLFSSCLALFVLFLLVYRMSGNSRMAFWAGLVLLFIPLYFNLSNTFMTDVNFVTLLLLYLLVAHNYLMTGKRWLFVPLLAISVAITLLRQYGLVLPLALLGSLIFSRWKDWQGIAILVFSFLLLLCMYRLKLLYFFVEFRKCLFYFSIISFHLLNTLDTCSVGFHFFPVYFFYFSGVVFQHIHAYFLQMLIQ
jgi:4-amino-4-deoxy-L-arabinose transferase-like glycosyltransferase